ncbi:MAG: type I methionyl aminopeptidase [Patescibacteria group bacterium]|jgi:methionyl aminopeptidase
MPKIFLKSPEEISRMAEAGEILGNIMSQILEKIEPGISTLEIDSWVEDRIINAGGEAAFKKVPRYHWATCTGINDEVVHSIPREDKILKEGDLLKIDMGMWWRGFNTDMSWTAVVQKSEVKNQKSKFLETGEKALEEAIKVARPGNRIGHISKTIQETVETAGYHPVRILTGHGIGRKLHEEPMIPGILTKSIEKTPEIVPGMTLAIEVIYNLGEGEVVLAEDGWTILTKDGKISGLFEKTIAITENGPLVLTPLRFSKKGLKN